MSVHVVYERPRGPILLAIEGPEGDAQSEELTLTEAQELLDHLGLIVNQVRAASQVGHAVVACPGCGEQRWYGYGPCSKCGAEGPVR